MSAQTADTVLIDALVRTADRKNPTAEAIAFADGRILAVGSASEVLTTRTKTTRVLSAAGRAIYPGFVDVHNHHSAAGITDLFELSFSANLGLDGILQQVRTYASHLPADTWITGGSWASTLMHELNSSTVRALLDEAAEGRPVVLSDDSHHNKWANTAALRFAGITAATLPGGGVAFLDPLDGQPTGVLLEDAGTQVTRAHQRVAAFTPEQYRRASQRGVELLNSFGVTTFQDAAVSVEIMTALAELDHSGELNAWVVSSMTVNDQIFGYDPVGEPLVALGEKFRTQHHRPDFVKIFLDGVPPARTALFLEPYVPDEEHGADFHGSTTMSAADLADRLREASARGLGAKVHATGDGTAHLLLDVVEQLRGEGHTLPVQLAHGQFLDPDDITRMVSLGVIADISPFLWFPGVIPQALAEVLGDDRANRSQPNRSILDAGGLVAGGSDWPVSESPNPLEGIQGLITRADPFHRAPGTLWPEQAISAHEALEVFSINAARAMGLGGETGSLEVGKSADIVILDRDAVGGAPDEIVSATVEETWFAGRRVFSRE